METISALLEILGILNWRMQEVRTLQNKDLRVNPAWSKNSRKTEFRPRDFPGFRHLRAAGSSSGLQMPKIHFPSGVGTFRRLNISLLVSLVDSRLPVLCASSFTSCEAMELAGTGYRREECPDLAVILLMVLLALRLQYEKSPELIASYHCSCLFLSCRESMDEAALSESVLTGSRWKE